MSIWSSELWWFGSSCSVQGCLGVNRIGDGSVVCISALMHGMVVHLFRFRDFTYSTARRMRECRVSFTDGKLVGNMCRWNLL
jgi:hypothetical protein